MAKIAARARQAAQSPLAKEGGGEAPRRAVTEKGADAPADKEAPMTYIAARAQQAADASLAFLKSQTSSSEDDVLQTKDAKKKKKKKPRRSTWENRWMSPIPLGAEVRVSGLVVRPELNGQNGTVVDYFDTDDEFGRCSVQLSDGRGPFKIRVSFAHVDPTAARLSFLR